MPGSSQFVVAVVLYRGCIGRFRVEEAPVLVRAARVDAGLTQAELAGRVGIAQSSLAQIERGARAVSPEMLERILKAADYRPSLALAAHAAAIRGIALAHGLENLRVFGSVLTGSDGFHSDIDLFFTPRDGTDLFDVALFCQAVGELTGFTVEAISDQSTGAQEGRLGDSLLEAVAL